MRPKLMETAEDPSGRISALAHPMNQQSAREGGRRGPGLFLGSTSSLAGNVKYFRALEGTSEHL